MADEMQSGLRQNVTIACEQRSLRALESFLLTHSFARSLLTL